MSVFTGKEKLKLGFGLMRLPKNEDGSIDVPQTSQMVDRFIEAGGTYFDTAFAYPGSEEAIRQALVVRYPRDSYTLATKLMVPPEGVNEEDAKREIYTSLERSGAGYFDYYLVHAIQRSNYKKYEEYGIWDYVKQLKDLGLIKHYGFSFHADPDLLEELLEKHPDVEFVQLQINYADWENPGVKSRINYEICKKHGKPVVVMEPVKGGILADPIDTAKAIFDRENNGMSYSSWALRFVASKDNLLAVLSGMSSIEQMKDNLSFMKDFKPLTEHEEEVIREVQEAYNADQSIPCTGCRYCTKGCPMGIPIPDIFTVQNRKKGSPEFRTKREYAIVTQDKGKASECIQCGQCEGVCPQHLPIIDLLVECQSLE
ncbi:MAG: aldo/keto reductase [Erysipelotrichaceae bacterium]|nr:aldo/keto reductase [Erysipelotrichaceae bacterium]MBR2745278.1 aldo/keto reductase [Erysipelotrichaceae bacterium]